MKITQDVRDYAEKGMQEKSVEFVKKGARDLSEDLSGGEVSSTITVAGPRGGRFPLLMYLMQDALLFHPQPLNEIAAKGDRGAVSRASRKSCCRPTAPGCTPGTSRGSPARRW